MIHHLFPTIIASVVFLSSGLHVQADIFLFEDFSSYTSGSSPGTQVDTGLDVYHSGTVTGWTGGGVNHSHAVDLDASFMETDFALQLFSGNSFEPPNSLALDTGIDANDLGTEYVVSFDAGPSVWEGPSQATAATDGLLVEILRTDGSILASYTHQPGAWPGGPNSQELTSQGFFTYTGEGSGAVTIRLATDPMLTQRFGGAMDNLMLASIPEPSPTIVLCALGVLIVGFTSCRRRTKQAKNLAPGELDPRTAFSGGLTTSATY